MPAKPKTPTYDAPNKLLWIAPAVLIPLGIVLFNVGNLMAVFGVLALLFIPIDIGVLYVKQVKYLRQTKLGKRLRAQYLLILIALIAPFIAIVAGDLNGARTYSTPLNGIGDAWGLILGALLAVLCAYACVLANEVYLKIRTGVTNDIASKVFYVLGYILVAVVSWFVYGLTYSLHDPSTE